MSARNTQAQRHQVTRSRKSPRRAAAFGRDAGAATARGTKVNQPGAVRVRGAAATLSTCLLILLTATAGAPPRGSARSSSSGEFARLRERVTARLLEAEPEEWRMLGRRSEAVRLKDWSPAAIEAEVEFCREAIGQLNAVAVNSPEEALDRDVLLSNLTYLEHYYGSYRGHLGNLQISVYPYDAIQYELLRFATGDRGARAAREHYGAVASMLRGLPAHLRQQQSNLLAGLKLRAPDKGILEAIMERIGSPGDGKSVRAGLREINQQLEKELRASLPPPQREELRRLLRAADAEYKRHLNFLETEIAPHAGVSWPLGREEYELRLRLLYGYTGTLEDLVRPAEESLRAVKEEMKSLARALRTDAPRTDRIHLRVLNELRGNQFRNGPELLRAYKEVQGKIDAALTTGLGLPAGTANYQRAPTGVPVGTATNWPAPLLAPGDALVLVDTTKGGLQANFKANIAWVAAHEGNPGHAAQSRFFQGAYRDGRAPLCRFLNVPDEVGYVRGNWYAMANIEGWAFYTERLLLAKNVLSPEERLAALTGQALRAARVVVDVRMHTEGWSRERVAEYLVSEAGLSCEEAHDQAFRYSKIPLQAISYFMGATEFEKLETKYKERFDHNFYERLLSLGPVPPTLIDKYLEASKVKATE